MAALSGKTALVTGGTTGIGLATAQRFAAEGARVFIVGRRKPQLDAAVVSIGSAVTGIQADVSDLADLDRVYATIAAEGLGLDVVFANAGGGVLARLEQATEEQYRTTFDINVKGTLFTVKKALPLLSDGSSIILTSSIAGVSGAEEFGVYAATKAAIRSLVRTWANELKDRGIRVNAVSPGPIDTPGIDGLAPDDEGAVELKKALASTVLFGRMGRPEEVASVVLFLATPESSFMTGGEVVVDGGVKQV
jgi:NAD(P)-dependent dehydrogenase (short-subunit alcohol dehydrogenase family)